MTYSLPDLTKKSFWNFLNEEKLGLDEFSDYQSICNFLIKKQERLMNYYFLVVFICSLGLLFLFILVCVLVISKSFDWVDAFSVFIPGKIFGFIGIAFNSLESEIEKKKLYKLLKAKSSFDGTIKDEKLKEYFKEWIMNEFKLKLIQK